ncbi:MAG: hypothetical protein J1E31_02510 [Helicobacter sp.]|nr:hypothetical protein [Helicobacter sp.]
MSIYKKWIILSLSICAFIVVALSTLFYIYDPLMLYHKPYFNRPITFKNMRVQDKFLIDNYDFNSIIIGSSMLRNTSAKEANDKLGEGWMNLSDSDLAFNERIVILKYALKNKEIKNIITSFDAHNVYDVSKFDFIYNDNIFDDIQIYFNRKYILCALSFSEKESCIGRTGNVEISPTFWADEKDKHPFSDKWVLKEERYKDIFLDISSNNLKFKSNVVPRGRNIEITKNNIKKYALELIQDNPNINFYFIVPTYSRLSYKLNQYVERKNTNSFFRYKAILQWFILEASKYPNVKIYGFDDLDYADNVSNYRDRLHYNIDMNSMQLDAIKNNTHILTPQNMDKYFEIMEEKIRNYDLEPFIKKAKEVLKEK